MPSKTRWKNARAIRAAAVSPATDDACAYRSSTTIWPCSVVPTATDVPLPGPDGPAGVLTFERDARRPSSMMDPAAGGGGGRCSAPVLRIQSSTTASVQSVRSIPCRTVSAVPDTKTRPKPRDLQAVLVVGLLCAIQGTCVTARATLAANECALPRRSTGLPEVAAPGDHLQAGRPACADGRSRPRSRSCPRSAGRGVRIQQLPGVAKR